MAIVPAAHAHAQGGLLTFTPRFFMALRFERNDYPFIRPLNNTIWIANSVIFNDTEIGAGYRPAATTCSS